MQKNNGILCTICARGGSKGVKNKNIKIINKKPLISYTIEQAKKSNLFEHIVVSSDNKEIQDISKEYGAEVFFTRDEELSSDSSGKLDVIKDVFLRSEKYFGKRFDYLIDLDATSPLRDVEDIKNSFFQFLEQNADNLITAMPSRRSPYFNMVELIDGKVVKSKMLSSDIVRRQDAPKCYDMNASIYIWKRDALLNNDTLFLENTELYVMPEERSFDIDSELDFKIVEILLKERKND